MYPNHPGGYVRQGARLYLDPSYFCQPSVYIGPVSFTPLPAPPAGKKHGLPLLL